MQTAVRQTGVWSRAEKRSGAKAIARAPKKSYKAKPVHRRADDFEAHSDDVMKRFARTLEILAR